ncbi:MAG: HNH endonuclease [Hyphomicrobiaceae bacterium]|nr:HNH endonuclease [Hyphomicrobiaceae bacterium]
MTRQALTKSVRFEVFKRDSFRCQYCGSEAPSAVLHVDHIEAVANGGTNDITNLITACSACNLGKSDKPLSENTAVEKSRNQMEELQERREQLQLMMEWRKGLRSVGDDTLDGLVSYWKNRAHGFNVTLSGQQVLEKLLRKYTIDEICVAMDAAAVGYLKFDEKDKPTWESVGLAFAKIGGVCRVNKASKDNPDVPRLLYIRGILRNRIPGYFSPHQAMDWLKAARSWDVSIEDLADIARRIKNWSQFTAAIREAIDIAKKDAA